MHIAGKPSAMTAVATSRTESSAPARRKTEGDRDREGSDHREDEDWHQSPAHQSGCAPYPIGQADYDAEQDHGREQLAQRHDEVVQRTPAPSPAA